jgi:hypothetical protein
LPATFVTPSTTAFQASRSFSAAGVGTQEDDRPDRNAEKDGDDERLTPSGTIEECEENQEWRNDAHSKDAKQAGARDGIDCIRSRCIGKAMCAKLRATSKVVHPVPEETELKSMNAATMPKRNARLAQANRTA